MGHSTQTCELCGRVQIVSPGGQGFPPEIAKRKLMKACDASGCPCAPKYRCGVTIVYSYNDSTGTQLPEAPGEV